jgi:hypothetical protein
MSAGLLLYNSRLKWEYKKSCKIAAKTKPFIHLEINLEIRIIHKEWASASL